MKMTTEEQTAICSKLREYLQSVAIQAVQAQDCIGSDKCSDLLYDIEQDVDKAMSLQNKLITADMQ
jgi:hypothetical protein